MRDRFRAAGIATAELDARLLAQFAFQIDAMALVRRERESLPPDWLASLAALAERRLTGEPVSRILGHREFWGLDFDISPAVLDPRPETELLVGEAVAALQSRPDPLFLDLGTGSGAIAVALAAAVPDAQGIATDISPEALAVAGRNARKHGVGNRLRLLEGSWWQAVPAEAKFDLVVSNPPYIASNQIAGLAPDVRLFDPRGALDGGWDGAEPYRMIAAQVRRHLRPGGMLLVEIGATQAETITKIFARAGLARIEVQKDLAGLDRVISATHS